MNFFWVTVLRSTESVKADTHVSVFTSYRNRFVIVSLLFASFFVVSLCWAGTGNARIDTPLRKTLRNQYETITKTITKRLRNDWKRSRVYQPLLDSTQSNNII